MTLSCGCEFEETGPYYGHSYTVARKFTYTRRCSKHAPKRKRKTKAAGAPRGTFPKFVTLPRSWREDKAQAQAAAYTKLMGRPFYPEPLPDPAAEARRWAQFDYTGAVRTRYTPDWHKVKLSKLDQLAEIVPGF